MKEMAAKISANTVRSDFNDLRAVMHYTRAAHGLGLWESERVAIERFIPDRNASLLEAGCGAGRATLGLWELGFRRLTAFDFAAELVDQARSLAAERRAPDIRFFVADATDLRGTETEQRAPYGGALFLFNGLMQIPGRVNRCGALRELHRLCTSGAPLLFTTHDRDSSSTERALWRLEKRRWKRGRQNPQLIEFGDRYFEDEPGRTFMHLPNRREVLEDLSATGWVPTFDMMRSKLARESRSIRDFSDECRFWAAHRG
jgi:SAM-dependent methyltransferase